MKLVVIYRELDAKAIMVIMIIVKVCILVGQHILIRMMPMQAVGKLNG
jgi:hypothetical protein